MDFSESLMAGEVKGIETTFNVRPFYGNLKGVLMNCDP